MLLFCLSTALSCALRGMCYIFSAIFTHKHHVCMEEEHFDAAKEALLAHIEQMFLEMEEEMAHSHQEKYALLEDAVENASDRSEEHTSELQSQFHLVCRLLL